MEHFPVQLIGGIVLHQGRIAEMRTGEGKTLVSTCPAYLNALKGKGVQIVTVNDYLANEMLSGWTGTSFPGSDCRCCIKRHEQCSEKEAYAYDITYVTTMNLVRLPA